MQISVENYKADFIIVKISYRLNADKKYSNMPDKKFHRKRQIFLKKIENFLAILSIFWVNFCCDAEATNQH
jgi:hypothetical protein